MQLKQSTALDLDTYRPTTVDLDDEKRGDVDGETKYDEDLPIQPAETPITYDELRRKNRENYQKTNAGMYGQSLPTQDELPPVIRAPTRPIDDPPKPTGPKNKYGDAWSQ